MFFYVGSLVVADMDKGRLKLAAPDASWAGYETAWRV